MPKKSKVKSPLEKGNFVLKNELLTIRFWSQSYTTSLFDKNVNNFTLVCRYPMANFNLDILKDISAAQLYLNVSGNVYISRVAGYLANIVPDSVTLQLALSNLRLKAAFDMEFNTSMSFYEQILAQKDFFKVGGKKLETYISPIGLARRPNETDQALRRRVISYLQQDMGDNGEQVDIAEMLKDLKDDTERK